MESETPKGDVKIIPSSTNDFEFQLPEHPASKRLSDHEHETPEASRFSSPIPYSLAGQYGPDPPGLVVPMPYASSPSQLEFPLLPS